jgi:hypothetical protein
MNQIFKFKDYNQWVGIAEDFLFKIINPHIFESNDNSEGIVSILNNLQRDLRFNLKLIFTFGTGVSSMYPIVLNLIKNQNLKIELTEENIVLLTLTSIIILTLETKKNSDIQKDEIRSLLTELKLRGIGNGIVKKMVKSLKSIGNLISILFKNTPNTVRSLIDMFAYTSVLIPTTNAINSIISDYNWTMDTVIGNLSALGAGLITFLAKNGWDYLYKKLKNKTDLNPELDKIFKNQEAPNSKVEDIFGKDTELIKEQ